jgi:hypothetical protein
MQWGIEMAKKKKQTCKQKGYHNWEVTGVNGEIDNEEVELSCSDCNATARAEVDFVQEED